MRAISLAVIVVAVMMLASIGMAQPAPGSGPYKILKTAKVGGEGGFDYISSDVENRRLYMPRSGMGHLTVFNLDTLEPVGSIDGVHSGGAVVDPKSHHGFSTTKPLTMWDANTLQVIKTIDVDGRPDGIMFDPYNARVWVLSHQPPYATVIDAKEGTVVGTVDLVGTAEQAVSDGKGTVYINISDKGGVAVVNAKDSEGYRELRPEREGRARQRNGGGCQESHSVCVLPRSQTGGGDFERRERQRHYHVSHGRGRGHGSVQSRHHGSDQRVKRRRDDFHQGK